MKTVPKHITKKVERMSKLMQQLVDLNLELEEWMERNGIDDSFDLTHDYRDDRGYGIIFPDGFVKAIESAINAEAKE